MLKGSGGGSFGATTARITPLALKTSGRIRLQRYCGQEPSTKRTASSSCSRCRRTSTRPGSWSTCSLRWSPRRRPPDALTGCHVVGEWDVPPRHRGPHPSSSPSRPLLVLAGILSSCASISPDAASVDQTSITRHDLNQELNDISASPRYVTMLESQGGQVAGTAREPTTRPSWPTLNQRLRFAFVHDEGPAQRPAERRADAAATQSRPPAVHRLSGEASSTVSGLVPQHPGPAPGRCAGSRGGARHRRGRPAVLRRPQGRLRPEVCVRTSWSPSTTDARHRPAKAKALKKASSMQEPTSPRWPTPTRRTTRLPAAARRPAVSSRAPPTTAACRPRT